jgi:hypothetical protein
MQPQDRGARDCLIRFGADYCTSQHLASSLWRAAANANGAMIGRGVARQPTIAAAAHPDRLAIPSPAGAGDAILLHLV